MNTNWSFANWVGKGYYSPFNHGDYTLYYFSGDTKEEAQEYSKISELGTPQYFETKER